MEKKKRLHINITDLFEDELNFRSILILKEENILRHLQCIDLFCCCCWMQCIDFEYYVIASFV